MSPVETLPRTEPPAKQPLEDCRSGQEQGAELGTKPVVRRPRLGFLGLGWIGRHRMEAIARSGLAEIRALADASVELAAKAADLAPQAALCDSVDALLQVELDGVVIATPSALHAEQAIKALQHGLAVFCQKPLGRNAEETRRVLAAARQADRLLGVDLSYRFIHGAREIHELCRGGQLGELYAAELVFHNAYGPDKPWFYDRQLSGGGCVLDLGIHLVDLALWNFGFPRLEGVTSRLFARGAPLSSMNNTVEDYAEARLDLAGGATIRLACSWNLPAGREACIRAAFYGTKGGAAFENVNGSFYQFRAERYQGTRTEPLGEVDEGWGGRAAVDWVQRLGSGNRFEPQIERLEQVATVLERIYEEGAGGGGFPEKKP